jgi:DNA polymerase-1
MIPITALIGTGKNQCLMSAVDIPKVAEYAVEDADIAWQLAELMERELRREGLWDLYWEIERPLIQVLADMEHTGIRVEPELLRQQSAVAAQRLEIIKQQIYALAGREFNIDSPLQLRKILFEELSLPVMKKTKTGASTDQEVLEKLELLHPLPAKLMEHRRLAKLKSTYLDALPAMINPETGKIHASFNQVVASTGRLSSSDPNLQNIPIRTEEGRRVREAFRPSFPDWKLLCADYSQIELRMLAHFSHDPALVQAFADDRDIHTAVAADIFRVAEEAVDAEMRRVAKLVNFGVLYGQSAFGLSAVLGIKPDEAAKYIDEYFSRYAGVEIFLRDLLEACRKKGYAETIRGRRRAIGDIRPFGPRRQLNLSERTAINAVIQGSAADLIKLAMINVHCRLREEGHPARLLLQIHDELVLETPPEHAASLAQLVRQEMEQALPLDVPLKVDLALGADWLNVT